MVDQQPRSAAHFNVLTTDVNAGIFPHPLSTSPDINHEHRYGVFAVIEPRNRTWHGVTVGILMVDSQFKRYVGDIGNALTWPFPVQYRVVRGATPAEMVSLERSDVLEPFLEAADELIRDGVDGISTTCGFLALYQNALARHCSVPVATSALLQVPMVERLIKPDQRVGILTYSREALSAEHLASAGVDPTTPVAGIDPESDFYRWVMHADNTVSFEALRRDVMDCAGRLIEENQNIGALVSECTNITPFAQDLHETFGLPVFDMVTLMNWFHMGLRPPRYTQ